MPNTGCEFVTCVHDIVGEGQKLYQKLPKSQQRFAIDCTAASCPTNIHCDFQLLPVIQQLWSYLFNAIYCTWSVDCENVSRPSENGPG
ncbi:unnamed protein product [Macrosiphum euphorbiae]|uniref:Uncharacterized protein n=1 Tax=Macrosiphum euphorbiae TaxID=13131 RepID=A0AAV0VNU8_9HEMI|nr:unnamed protein product [Macrosiphum euphorbiae]